MSARRAGGGRDTGIVVNSLDRPHVPPMQYRDLKPGQKRRYSRGFADFLEGCEFVRKVKRLFVGAETRVGLALGCDCRSFEKVVICQQYTNGQ